MAALKPLDKFTVPLGGQGIELQEILHAEGGMALLRLRIREGRRFTVFDIDAGSARRWGEAMLSWARSQPPARQEEAIIQTTGAPQCAELSFAVSGGRLQRDHSLALWQALEQAAPWLAAEQSLAVLPVRAAASGEYLLLNRRSRLLMRLPEVRIEAACALCGRHLDVAGETVRLGDATRRPLAAHATLYAHRVAAEGAGEDAFVVQVARQLDELGVHTEFIVGQRASARGPAGALTGFSLMLAGLRPPASLALQATGLGAHRRLGFGVFVGHRFTSAVGSEELEQERRSARNT